MSPGSLALCNESESGPVHPDMRLPLEWNQRQARRLLAGLHPSGAVAVLLTVPWNIVHFTGLWAATTERPLFALLRSDAAPMWFYPRLDRDLVHSWWFGEGVEYFDYPHVSNQFPNEGNATPGAPVELWEWMLQECAKRGLDASRLRVDRELSDTEQQVAVRECGAPLTSIASTCLAMRIRKCEEELALIRRAYSYFDRIHAHGRDVLLSQWTPELTDFALRTEMIRYGTELIMADLQPDGLPHQGVGISVDLGWIRAGTVTGYPHPNQVRYSPIRPGEVLQASGVVRIGGYGGECYRPYLFEPRTEHQERLWTTVRDTCLLQQRLMVPGARCGDIAAELHEFQIAAGMAEYIYHRPAHGQGPEGHQPPWLALGDDTVLEAGMCLSVEPGLYDPKAGFSINFSDTFVVQEGGSATQMSTIPWSEEWCWLTLPQ